MLIKEIDLIFDKIFLEVKKLLMGEFLKLIKEVEDLNEWSEKLKEIIFDLKEKKGRF